MGVKVYTMRLCLIGIIKNPRDCVPLCEIMSLQGCAGYPNDPLPTP